MNQVEYTEFYDRLRKYAIIYTGDFFKGEAEAEDAVDKAMNAVEDWLLTNPQGIRHRMAYIKTTIRNSIKKSSKAREFEVVDINWNGKTGYQRISRLKPLKVRLEQISNEKHKQIVRYYLEGLTQEQIGEKAGVVQQRVSQILSNYI